MQLHNSSESRYRQYPQKVYGDNVGYAKNIFTVRAKKTDYVASKTILCTLGGIMMIFAFFVGSLIGGALFDLGPGAVSNPILKKTSLI